MDQAEFEARVSKRVESIIAQLGDRAVEQARADLIRALDLGAVEVAVAYEVCLRLMDGPSPHVAPTLAVGPPPNGFRWLRNWLSPAGSAIGALSAKAAG